VRTLCLPALPAACLPAGKAGTKDFYDNRFILFDFYQI
jgi:hypothetical protein